MRLRDMFRGSVGTVLPADPSRAPSAQARCWSGQGQRPVTRAQFRGLLGGDAAASAAVRHTVSFVDLLFPKTGLGDGAILMRDLRSVGRLYDVVPVSTEGRRAQWLEELHGRILPLLRDVFPQEEQAPWLAQFFVYDQHELDDELGRIRDYIAPEIRDTEYSRHWLEVLQRHFLDAVNRSGMFVDPASRSAWRGRRRRVRLCVWRVAAAPVPAAGDSSLEGLCARLEHAMAQTGIRLLPQGAQELCRWWRHWFGSPAMPPPADAPSALALFPEGVAGDLGAAAFAAGAPWSEAQRGCWHFQGRPHRFLTVNSLLREPSIGHLTAERGEDDRQALWDRMPPGAVWSMVVAFQAQDQVLEHIARVKRNAVGGDPQAVAIRNLADEARRQIAEGNPVLPVFSGVFLSAENPEQLQSRSAELSAQLLAHGMTLVRPEHDPIALDAYIRALPFNFDPEHDRKFYVRRSRLWYLEHALRCLPFYGRFSGTGHPGFLAWNRGAEPLAFDPLNRMDRTKNAHVFIFGPTGSGKTALLINTLLHMQAVHRPRMYLVTALPTFGLLAQHFAALGLTVHFTHGDRTPIPPFADAAQLVAQAEDAGRDLLGEMELQARLMITGAEPREEARLAREDLGLIRKALLALGARAREHPGRAVLTEDLIRVMRAAAGGGRLGDDALSDGQRQRLQRMADAVELFCSGQAGRIFNRPGRAWPEADVTVIELGALAHRRNEAWLAVAMTGLLSRINDQVQHQQYSARQTLVVLDEAHLLLKNPLIAPYILSISAMWRTYGAWLWIVTQNLRQIPETARELLNQPEWWICMAMERDEVEMISRFRALNEEQKAMLLSARKEPGKYTEGVVLSGKFLALFRNVVPALSLALSQTEKDEKAHRAELMRAHGCSELQAAYRIGEEISRRRRGEPAP